MSSNGQRVMDIKALLELMELRGWNQAQLSREFDVAETTVSKWLKGERHLTGPTKILLRLWLDEARAKAKKKNRLASAPV